MVGEGRMERARSSEEALPDRQLREEEGVPGNSK